MALLVVVYDPYAVKVRSLFLSDIHLGSHISCVDELNSLLDKYEPDTLYLVGDIIDLPAKYWDDKQKNLLKRLLYMSDYIAVYWLPGNHDKAMRAFNDITVGNVVYLDSTYHITADGKMYWLIHGDKFDLTCKYNILDNFFTSIYNFFIWLDYHGISNRQLTWITKQFINQFASKISGFEKKLVEAALTKKAYGVICGHSHLPKFSDTYINLGDWVDHCTALVEHENGTLELVNERNDNLPAKV